MFSHRKGHKEKRMRSPLDVVIIGGGPAGISAALELSRSPELEIALFESESQLGGIPRTCHAFFGMRDQKWIHTGPAYAQRLNQLIRKSSTKIYTGATVLEIRPGSPGEHHRIDVVSQQSLESYESRFVLLTTGCYESSRGARFIPGTRPSGIFTTGPLQQIVNIYRQRPGKRALIIGSEHIALSSVMTLRRAGMSIAGMVEESPKLQTYAFPAKAMSFFYNFPIHEDTSIQSILGHNRVEGVELVKGRNKTSFNVECDTVILTGKFRPDSSLIDNTPIERDPSTLGPYVDMNLMTSVPNIFAAGNILRGGDMHDLCALEGKKAARSILERVESGERESREGVSIRVDAPIRHVVPQKIAPDQIRSPLLPWLFPGCSIQLENTLVRPTLEVWSGNQRIWEKSFLKLIANRRVCIPIEKFDWDRVDAKKGITVGLKPNRRGSRPF
jgi:thioredoxin reductase